MPARTALPAPAGRRSPRRTRTALVAAVAVGLVALGVAVAVLVGMLIGGGGEDDGGAGDQGAGSRAPAEPTREPLPFETELLAERTGFAASVEGGYRGEVVRVTSDEDDGPGSLREALERKGRTWIQFDRDMTITLESPLEVGSWTTVDGRGQQVTITAPGEAGLVIEEASDVILTNLTLSGFGDAGGTARNDPDDAILVTGSERVWIDHCDLARASDKLIDVSAGSRNITVSWNRFHDQEQVFQIGNQATRDAGEHTVTAHHNFFERTGYRHPAASHSRVHVFNNVFLDWDVFAVQSQREAQVLLERNVFEAGRNPRATLVRPGGNGCNDARTRCDDSPGYLRAAENLTLGGAVITESSPEVVFDPAGEYQYVADPAGPALTAAVQAGAGPR